MTEKVFELLQAPIQNQIERYGIVTASNIQRLAIPSILKGQNVLLIAPTGTGKTLAAILPIFDLYLSLRKKETLKGIQILYITPLRALNRDLLRRLLDSGHNLGLNVQVRHGDTPNSVRVRQAKLPPDMLITTPETLQAILPGKKMKEHLKNIKWIIVDEIHELATDKRGAQLSIALERLRNLTNHNFQRIGLSATVGEAEKIAEFLKGSSNEAVILKSVEFRGLEVKIEYINANQKDHEGAKTLGIPATAVSRARRICELLSEHHSTLIFTNTREHAEALGSQITAIGCKNLVKVHHGSLSKEVREEVEEEFQSGKINGVICTSSLELGIDIGTVDLVIQYMSPRESTRLIQRIGRSGHKISSKPQGHIIAAGVDDILESAVLLKYAIKEQFETVKVHEGALDVLAHQIVGLILDKYKIPIDDAYKIIKGAYPYRNVIPETFYDIVNQLQQQRVINFRDKKNLFPKFPNARQYYYENLSVIPDIKKYTVFDFALKKRLGTLDQEFVAKRCRMGTEFILHGNSWRVISVDEEKRNVEVEAVAPSLNSIPSWEGEIIPVEHKVALEVGRLREVFLKLKNTDGSISLSQNLQLDQTSEIKVKEVIDAHNRDYPIPTDKQILIERFENCTIIHACFGNLVNETIGLLLFTLLQAKYGINILIQVDAYRIALLTAIKLNPKIIMEDFLKIKPEEIIQIIESTIEKTELFAWRHWHIAKRFRAIEAKAEYNLRRARLLVEVFRKTPINFETRREIYLEKYDIKNTIEVIQKIISKEINIVLTEQKGTTCSPLALPIVDKIVPHNLLRPALPNQHLTEIVKERLMSTNVRLICIFNADWESVRAVGTIPEIIICPKCKSTLIAIAYHGDQELLAIIIKKKNHKKLSSNEEERWNRAWKSASLVQSAGKKAILTMAARGIGPTTAARILRRYIRNEAEFYSEIIKAEREYQRTRMFWD